MTAYATRGTLKETEFTVVEISRQETPWNGARIGYHAMPPGWFAVLAPAVNELEPAHHTVMDLKLDCFRDGAVPVRQAWCSLRRCEDGSIRVFVEDGLPFCLQANDVVRFVEGEKTRIYLKDLASQGVESGQTEVLRDNASDRMQD